MTSVCLSGEGSASSVDDETAGGEIADALMQRSGADGDDAHDRNAAGQIVNSTGHTAQKSTGYAQGVAVLAQNRIGEQHRPKGATSEAPLHHEHTDQVNHREGDQGDDGPPIAVSTVGGEA